MGARPRGTLMARKPAVVITMPAFNEESVLPSFLADICEAFAGLDFQVIVVNDCSTDNTEETLHALATRYPLNVHTNPQNAGHGPSTLTALRLATELNPHHVVATDGDGHITGSTLRELYNQALNQTPPAVMEGARTHRNDPWFRKTVSAITRVLVKHHSGSAPRDANTPFRVYPTSTLEELLANIPADHMTPNLMMATLVRRDGIPFQEVPITPHKRKGTDNNGSTWKQRFRFLPSRRFLQFCVKATTQWVTPQKAAP